MAKYRVRSPEEMTPLAQALAQKGLLAVSDIYSVADLAAINSAMDPVFASRAHEPRSYVRADDMVEKGIFNRVLSRKMKDLILSVVPSPVLYHFHAYEIDGNQSMPHIFGDALEGWHRDPDSEYFPNDPSHISVFVYLTDVATSDGAFEFCPQQPDLRLRSDSPVLSMIGPAGMSFVWQRGYYHRASPNRGTRRRRVLKVSVQPNVFTSYHIKQPFFNRVREKVPEGDVETDLLLGRYQGKQAPDLRSSRAVPFYCLTSDASIKLPESSLEKLNNFKKSPSNGEHIAYD